MIKQILILLYLMSHNPYFSRRFFAIITKMFLMILKKKSHNPYFSRRFFAINPFGIIPISFNVTILILVEGSLQLRILKIKVIG